MSLETLPRVQPSTVDFTDALKCISLSTFKLFPIGFMWLFVLIISKVISFFW